MPSPREIGIEKNRKSLFDTEPNDDEINEKAKEPDYTAHGTAAPREEPLPFKNLVSK